MQYSLNRRNASAGDTSRRMNWMTVARKTKTFCRNVRWGLIWRATFRLRRGRNLTAPLRACGMTMGEPIMMEEWVDL